MMNYKKKTNAVCLSDVKQAALYFDRVYFVDHSEFIIHEIFKKDTGTLKHSHSNFISDIHKQAYYELTIGTQDINSKYQKELLEKFKNWRLLFYMLSEMGLNYETIKNVENIMPEELIKAKSNDEFLKGLSENSKKIKKRILSYLISDLYINNTIVSVPDGEKYYYRDLFLSSLTSLPIMTPDIILPTEYSTQIDTDSEDITVVLNNIPLINTENLSWEQILAIRNDKDSIKKLRNLKLFTYANYQDKPRTFIEDDISKRIDDYKETCKEYRFETSLSALSTTLSSKNLMATAAAGLCATFLGGPLAGIGTSTFIELGLFTLEITKSYRAYKKIKNDHPLAYIIDIKKKTE